MERNKAIWGIILLMVMVLLPSISAFGETISIDEKLKTDLIISDSAKDYPALSIKGFWDLLPLVEDTKADLVLTKHDASCVIDCMSEFQIVTYQDSPLIEDIKFYRLDEGKKEERSIRSYQFQYYGDVPDYVTECSPAKLTEEEIKNGTKEHEDCVQVESGSHKDWINLDIGKELPAGTYDIKLLGQKAPYMSIDWVIKTQGKMITEWATWGNISTGSQAEVRLNSPTNNSVQYTTIVTTNASANVTNGAYLVNATLYDNSTGSWGARNSSNLGTSVAQSSLVSYYKLDETTGTTTIDSMASNNGTISSATISQTGLLGKAYKFDGSTNYVYFNNVDIGQTWTYNFWIKADGSWQNGCIICAGNNLYPKPIEVDTTSTGQIRFAYGGGDSVSAYGDTGPSTATFSTSGWHMVTVTYNSTGGFVYMDGVYSHGLAIPKTQQYVNNLMFGRRSDGYSFKGYLDEVGKWNKSLTQAEITQLYNSGAGLFTISTTSATITNTNTYLTGSNIKWNYQFCDSDGACGFAPQNFTFTVDGTAPTITLNYPTSLINYGAVNGTLQLNITATDAGGLASLKYDYNGTNVTLTGATSGVANISNITLSTKKNVTIYATDNAGNINTTTFSWDYYVLETGSSYSMSVAEGTSSNFSSNLTMTDEYRLSTVILYYNGTATTGSALEITPNNWFISASRNAPSVAADTNYTFYWTLTFENGIKINTTSNYQTVINIAIDDCTTYSTQLFNFTMVDEETQTKIINNTNITTTIKIDMQFKNPSTGQTVINYSKWYNNTNPARICSGSTVGNSSYRVDAQVQYSSTGRFIEFYNIQYYLLNTSSSNQNITLYDLNSSIGQQYKITYKGLDFTPVQDLLVQVQRKYVDEGVFKTIEIPASGTNGYTIAHLVTNDVIYNLIFMKDGVILDSFLDVIATCQNPSFTECEINLNAAVGGTDLIGLVQEDDFFSSLSYNTATRTITSLFGINSGVAGNTSLQVYLIDNFGNTSVCSDSLVSAGGTLTCIIPSTFGNASVQAIITLDGETRRTGYISLASSPKEKYAGILVFMAIIMLLFILGIAIQDNPMIMGVFLIVGLFILIALNMVYSTSWLGAGATALWFVIAVVMILIKGGSKR